MPTSETRNENRTPDRNEREKNTVGDYFALGEVATYFFRKRKPINFNVRMMHGINKLSILMFLVGVLVVVIRRFFF